VAEVSQAIEIAEARLKVSPNDARAMYALGISYGLRSNYNWVVRKAWHDSLRDATAARRFHNRVSELEPSNVDARLVQGLHDYIVGSLPLMYRMLGFLVGIRGDKEQGIRTVQQVASAGKLNCVDAEIFLGALYRRENQPRLAIPIVERLMRRYPRNYLLWLELSQMYSMAGDGKRALEILDQLAQLKTRHAPGYDGLSWEKIHFQRGTTQFWYRDLDHALENLNKVAAAAEEVDLNTGAYAFLRIGQIYDLKNRRGLALEAYKKALAYAPQAEAAQESQKYISHPYRRPTLQ
jgi:tetratricopeptide (TPR) repeat protein